MDEACDGRIVRSSIGKADSSSMSGDARVVCDDSGLGDGSSEGISVGGTLLSLIHI